MNRSLLSSIAVLIIVGCGSAASPSDPETKGEVPGSAQEEVLRADGKTPDAGDGCVPAGATVKSCTADYTLFEDAKKSCKAESLILNEFKASESCGSGNSAEYSYTCCPTAPSCGDSGGSGGPKCVTDESSFVSAEDSCPGGVATFTATKHRKCAAGSAKDFSFSCSCLK